MKQIKDNRVIYFLNPNASPAIYAIGGKVLRVLSEAAESVVFVCSEIPPELQNFDNVKIVDIKVRFHRVESISPRWYSAVLWISKFVYVQLRMGLEVFRQRNQIDIVLCFLTSNFLVPSLVGRLLGKRVVCGATGIDLVSSQSRYNSFVVKVLGLMMRSTYDLADAVIIEGWGLSRDGLLSRWADKMVNGALYFGNEEVYFPKTKVEGRTRSIGFIGRLSAEKGILEFVDALPRILEDDPNVEVIIAGSGDLDQEVRNRVGSFGVGARIKILSWVKNEDLPELYNSLRLVVIPSFTEGLPNVLLEAMSCGTAVLASAVGGIPEIVKDGVTGFLLAGNSPKEIAGRVLEVINEDELLQTVTENALALVREKYSFQASVGRYKGIFLFDKS